MGSTSVQAVEQSTGAVKEIPLGGSLAVKPGDVLELALDRDQVAAVERVGQDLVLTLKDGSQLTFQGYYDADDAGKHAEVALQDDNGELWWLRGEETGAFTYTEIASLDEVGGAAVVAGAADAGAAAAGLSTGAMIGIGALVLGGLAAVAGGGGGGGGSPSPTPTDTTPPSAPTAGINDAGDTVSGNAEPGSKVTVTGPDGSTLGTGTTGSDGHYTVDIPPQNNGQDLGVTATDPAGNTSDPTQVTAPDTTAPGAPTAAINEAGDTISGNAEPGSTVTVTDADGHVLGTATAGEDGSYSVSVPAQTDGQELQVAATDAAGNTSDPTDVTAPTDGTATDTTPPDAPTAEFGGDGTTVSGTAEPGSTVTVTDADGNPLGTTTAGSDGSYTVTLDPPQTNGEEASVTATDGAGNTSDPTEITAPDSTAPDAPTAEFSNDGTTVSGTAEPGSVVTVTDADGHSLGTATAGSDGSYTVTLSTPQTNGEDVGVTATDSAGNASDATEATAPDTTAPDAPTAAFSDDGTTVSGTAEPGSTVTVTDADGHSLGTATAGSDGSYAVTLDPPQTNGEQTSVTATDGAGNASNATEATAPDLTVPDAPTAAFSDDGTTVSGIAEPGSTVAVTDADGHSLGTATAGSDGSYTVTLGTPQTNGEDVGVTATDGAGNTSGSTDATAPDLTAPDAPTAAFNDDGTIVSGTAEPGSTVTVTDADGHSLGTATAGSDGSYTVTLGTPQTNGEDVGVTATDGAGNTSGPAQATAPDFTAPDAPTAAFNDDGTMVSGTAEPGSTVTVIDADGHSLGTATAGSDGSYTVTLSTPQTNGEDVGVTAADAAGNTSGSTDAMAPDLTAPDAPTAAIDDAGAVVSGTAEAGSAVTVYAPDGTTVLGTGTADASGNYSITLDAPRTDGEHLTVTATDAAHNASAPAEVVAPDLLLAAVDDVYTLQEGNYAENIHDPQTNQGVTNFDLLNSDGSTAVGSTVTVQDGWVGDLTVTVAQNAIVALAGAYQVDVYDSANNLVYVATTSGQPLVGDAGLLGTGVLGVTSDGSGLTFTVSGLQPGDYHVVVGDDSSTANALVQTLTLQELGDDGAVLGADNQQAVLDAVHAALANGGDDSLADTVTGLLGIVLNGTNAVGVGELVNAVSDIPLISGSEGLLDTVLDAISGAVLNNTLILLQTTDLTTQLTEYQYDNTELTGNVVTDAEGADDTDPGSAVTAIAFGDGDPVALTDGVATIAGAYGTLTIHDDGSYSYDSNGTHDAIGHSEVFTYTLSDGTLSDTATLTINIADDLETTAPTAAFSDDGGSISGTGNPGDTITVYANDADGDGSPDVLGTATVDDDGNYTVALDNAKTDGQDVTVTAQDEWGNQASATATAPDDTPLIANDDVAAVDMGGQHLVSEVATETSNVDVVGLLQSDSGTDAGATFTVADDQVSNVVISVSQTALASVASAFVLDVYDSDGKLVYAASGNPALAGDVAGLGVLHVSGDDTLTASIDGLPPGDYNVVVRNDSSTLNDLVQNLSLQELGDQGAVLGADNQADALAAIQAALNGDSGLPVGLGDIVAGVLGAVLTGTNAVGLGDIVQAVTDIPLVSTLLGGADQVLDVISGALLSNTATLFQTTDIGIDQTSYAFDGVREVDGNVLTEGAGADAYVDPAAAITAISNSEGDTVAVAAGTPVAIDGQYGTLTIDSDGSYSYEAYGSRASVGQTEVFTYTLSGSGSTDTATLSIAIDGMLVDAHDDHATALVSDVHPVTTDEMPPSGIDADVLLSVAGSSTTVLSDSFTVDADTTKDLVLNVDTDATLGLGNSFTLQLQEQQSDGSWVTVNNGTSGGVLDLLGLVDNQGQFEFDNLEAGTYRLEATYQSVLSLGAHLEVDVDSSTTHLDEYSSETAVGNLLTGDPGDITDDDITGNGEPALAIQQIDGSFIDVPAGDEGLTITGKYGTLQVLADGDYRYTPDPVLDNVGKSESFTYQITDADGHADAATLTVDIADPNASTDAMTAESLGLSPASDPLLIDGGDGGTVDLGTFAIEPVAYGAGMAPPLPANSEDELLHQQHALA